MFNFPIVLIILIGITVLMSLKGFNDSTFFNRYCFNTSAVKAKQYDRLLSSGFLHVDISHLLFNMLTLYFFSGHGFIQSIGVTTYVLIYVGAIVIGNLVSYGFNKDNPDYTAVGASGGVSGIVFATIILIPDLEISLFYFLPLKGWVFALLYLGYSMYGTRNQHGNIGHSAHLGGAFFGLLTPVLIYPNYIIEAWQQYIGHF